MLKPRFLRIAFVFYIILWIDIFNLIGNGPLFTIIHVYPYGSMNTDFVDTCFPEKGHRLDGMLMGKNDFDEQHQTKTIICRKFKKNYLQIWMWYTYWKNPYYQFPYCN